MARPGPVRLDVVLVVPIALVDEPGARHVLLNRIRGEARFAGVQLDDDVRLDEVSDGGIVPIGHAELERDRPAGSRHVRGVTVYRRGERGNEPLRFRFGDVVVELRRVPGLVVLLCRHPTTGLEVVVPHVHLPPPVQVRLDPVLGGVVRRHEDRLAVLGYPGH